MLSFWEKKELIKADYIIVGGGLVGLTAACRLKEMRPSGRVVVLERGILPSGASSKNAGFACFGSISELLADWQTMGKERALSLVQKRWRGLQVLQARLGAVKMGLKNYGGYELLQQEELHYLDKIEEVNLWLKPLFKKTVVYNNSEELARFGFAQSTVKGLVFNPYEGQIDTGLMMKNLAQYVQAKGVEIYTGSKVLAAEPSEKGYIIQVENFIGENSIAFEARGVGVCTNAFAKTLLPELKLQPGRGQVLVTEPIADLPWRGTFHMDEGYYYFRNFNKQVIFGGGRNLDIKGETTTDLALNNSIQEHLVKLLKEVILPKHQFKVAHRWSGVMAFGETKEPIVEKLPNGIAVGVRLGGMGVALGSQVGEQVAELLLAP